MQTPTEPLPVRFDETGDEVDDDEVMTAAESYERLLTNTKQQLFEMVGQLHKYDSLIKKLRGIRDERTRDVLVPVAGGLGYFNGRITHTNEMMVLLGNNWFAERSVAQSIGIAERRVEFLRRETKVLEEQVKSIISKQDMFVASAVEQQQQQRGVTTTAAGGGAAKKKPTTTTDQKSTTSSPSTVANKQQQQSKNVNNKDQEVAVNESDDEEDFEFDEDQPIIEPEDELTLQELVEIENQLGDDIENEELAEKAILARIAEKRRKRLGLPEKQAVTTATTSSTTPPSTQSSETTTATTAESGFYSAPSQASNSKFINPSDIGRGFVAAPDQPTPAAQSVEAPQPAVEKETVEAKKQVRFADPQPQQQQPSPIVSPPSSTTSTGAAKKPAATVRSSHVLSQKDEIIVRDSSSSDDEDEGAKNNRQSSSAHKTTNVGGGAKKKSRFASENGL